MPNMKHACLPSSGSPCTGCGLCLSVCPHGAIKMAENAEGFLHAEVDAACCVGCKACEKMCARLTEIGGQETHRCYEAWSLDERLRKLSSSGGAFGELAADCIRRGGVVYGVSMQGGEFPRYVAVDSIENLHELRGSKYLQADTGDVFARVASHLKEGRPVLFAGVSCQVRAARVRFGERYPGLLLVDLACFGVPSRHLFRSLMSGLKNKADVVGVNFRDKRRGWRSYSMCLTHADGTQTLIHRESNPFMRGFLCRLGLNRSCYTCRSALNDRPGDISLGDFWGRPHQEDERNGVSVVITHTLKGETALAQVAGALHLLPVEESLAVSCNGGMVAHNGQMQPVRKAFLHALKHWPLERVLGYFLTSDGQLRPGICRGCWFIPYPAPVLRLLRRVRRHS